MSRQMRQVLNRPFPDEGFMRMRQLAGRGSSEGQEYGHLDLKESVLLPEGQVLSVRTPPPSGDLY